MTFGQSIIIMGEIKKLCDEREARGKATRHFYSRDFFIDTIALK